MWNDILAALCIVGVIIGGIVLIPAAPPLVDAVCDRIRNGATVADATEDGAAPANDEEESPALSEPPAPAVGPAVGPAVAPAAAHTSTQTANRAPKRPASPAAA